MSDLLKLDITNKFTGEIFSIEVDPYKLDSLIEALVQVQEQRKALDELEADLKGIIEEDHLKPNDYRPVSSNLGFDVMYFQPSRKVYDAAAVYSHIDPDLLLSKGALAVSNSKLEKLMADLVRKNELKSEDSKAILNSVQLTQTKPYVKLMATGRTK